MKAIASLVLLAIFSATASATVNIEMVTVGNPGNVPDTRFDPTGFGSVDHVYQIGKYEVTAGQYTEFLNAVAKADPNGLYNAAMGDPSDLTVGANILRMGSSPNYSYSVAVDWANRPVNYVSFLDAARFANWLHNGQPIGPQGPSTTEQGAYGGLGNINTFFRQPGARFFLPTENEWYKAAYHKNDGPTGNYWDYPTASNSAPINTLPDPGNHANFYDTLGTGNDGYSIGSPYYRTEAGVFGNSASSYGTFDQGGNVWEYNETRRFGSSRGVRGGAYISNSFELLASYVYYTPTDEDTRWGFRVASIPEPASLTLSFAGMMALVLWRGRKQIRQCH